MIDYLGFPVIEIEDESLDSVKVSILASQNPGIFFLSMDAYNNKRHYCPLRIFHPLHESQSIRVFAYHLGMDSEIRFIPGVGLKAINPNLIRDRYLYNVILDCGAYSHYIYQTGEYDRALNAAVEAYRDWIEEGDCICRYYNLCSQRRY